ncbi:MAG: ribonuclease Y [Candidatus Glassbacteria bacterium]
MIVPVIFMLLAAGIFFLGYYARKRISSRRFSEIERESERILNEAKREADNITKSAELECKEMAYREKAKLEEELSLKRQEIERMEWRVKEREANFDRKLDLIEKKEKDLSRLSEEFAARDKALKAKDARLTQLISEQNLRLERIAGLTAEEAKKQLIANLEEEARLGASQYIKERKEEAKRIADREARKIITQNIQRYAADHVVESTVSVVSLPNDEMKGRIIGREGRNIRSFEMATGVNVIIDDTPEAVILSSFDPIRREVARLALEKLVSDGRIHPGRIEDMVEKARRELNEMIRQAGEETIYEVGIQSLHPELIRLLGMLKYRTSYGQNVLQHLKEAAFICGLMAAELHLDAGLAKRAALLHDIGKAMTHESEGTHVQLGAELARKYGEKEIVVSSIEAHHDDVEHKSLISVLVQSADAISGARPGARRETFETYIKRLEKLEEIADSFDGIQKSYAIQAGREIRVVVEPADIDDARLEVLASEIARKIEKELEYPGHIKISMIRETRAIDYAR